jgi:hypothetical protein
MHVFEGVLAGEFERAINGAEAALDFLQCFVAAKLEETYRVVANSPQSRTLMLTEAEACWRSRKWM